EHERWEPKYTGMQIITEGLAIAAFRFMHAQTGDELLKELLEYIMKDESRHVGFGMLALRDAVRKLGHQDKKSLEEFAFAACDMTITKVEDGVPRDGFLSYSMVFDEMGIPMDQLRLEMNGNPSWKDAERELEKQFNSMLFVDTLIPCLRQLGLLNDRTESWYADLGVLSLAA
ncbi:MAG TPA: ferritin-like domain-containing protein, partial [Candidatus Binataceae bacterium]|nr:ferritin-like domain-containing protein [Candidatus Binataceae bacterium]